MGIYGKTLHVDLTEKRHFLTPIQDRILTTQIGGRGLNVGYMHDRVDADIDPLAPENPLLFSCGLLTGTVAPASSRLHINAVSPLTGLMGSSNIGGQVGLRLRTCGIQRIIVRGRAAQPVFLYIDDKGVEIRDARFLRGLNTFDTQEKIMDVLGNRRLACLVIGPAGENLARFACILSGKDHAAGRTGMGAVMGSKNLKAVVLAKGGQWVPPVKTSQCKQAIRTYVNLIKDSPDFKIFARYGGAGYVRWADDMGILSSYNYRQTHFEAVAHIDGRLLEAYKLKSTGCHNCPVQCKAVLSFARKKKSAHTATRPEFEPMLNLGAKCGLEDLKAIVRLDNLCSSLGLDSTSASTAIAFAMDLFERGIITPEDTQGLTVSWGDAETMQTLIHQMARGDGFGGILAQGVKRAAQIIGKGSDRYAAHVKGLELAAYHPGNIMGTALGYAISSRGGDYSNVYSSLEHRWSEERAAREIGSRTAVDIRACAGKGQLMKRAVLVNIVLDSLGLCKVPVLSMINTFDLESEAELAAALTGLSITPETLFSAGKRIADMERIFNLRQNSGLEADTLPEIAFNQPDSNLSQETLKQMIAEYYEAMGWDRNGVPSPGETQLR